MKNSSGAFEHRQININYIYMQRILYSEILKEKKKKKMLCADLKVWQVLVTSLSLENIGYLEPANFWIGPAAVRSEHTLTNTSNKKHKNMQI